MAEDTDNDPYAPHSVPPRGGPQPGMSEPSSYLPPDAGAPQPVYGSTPIPPPPPPPGYGHAPGYGPGQAYGAPPAPGSAYAMNYAVASNDSRNVLGILALVFPFIGLAFVGIILGHLGLSAVKNGLANNRGVALAGTIVSYVFTFLGLLWFILVIVIAASDDAFNYSTDTGAVKDDLTAIGEEVSAYWVDGTTPPDVRVDGDQYVIGDATVPVSVRNPELLWFGDSVANWCVELRSDSFPSMASMSAADGYQPWLDCEFVNDYEGAAVPDESDAPVPTGEAFENATVVSLFDLSVGDCVLDPYAAAVYDEKSDTYTLWDVYVVPCEDKHYGEVTAVADFTDEKHPGDDVVFERLDTACEAAFEDYVGIDYFDSEYYFDYFYPTAASWAAGDREYTCLAYGLEDFSGSLRGAAR